jgi:hypothetical protein
MEEANANLFYPKMYAMLRYADRLERESTNFDLSVFE